MRVDVIETLEALAKLERHWHAVYDADPEAQFFLSWGWISQLLKGHSGWCVLAARRDDAAADYVAFFPLRLGVRSSERRGMFVNEIEMAGSFGWADYTGFVCHPDHEAEAVPAFSSQLLKMHWAKLSLRHLRVSDRQFTLFMGAFSGDRFVVEDRAGEHERKSVNNAICPHVELPGDFETYLKEKLSANTRQKLRRLMRQVEASTDLRITEATAATLERDLDVLEAFWKVMWVDRKGERVEYLAGRYRQILQQGFESGALYMPVLWRGEKPLGALGCFVDRQKKALLYFVGGRDESCDDPPPGLVLHAHTIRWAIGNGLRTYDFLRGNESFKYSFGAIDRRIRNIVVRTKDGKNLNGALDPRSVDDVIEQTVALAEAGQLQEAEAGYRQVLHVRPDDAAVLRGYGALLYGSGRYAEALGMWRTAAEARHANAPDWRQVGKCLLGLHEYTEAEAAFRRAIALDASVSGYYYLARALRGQGKEQEAVAALEAALQLAPRGEKEKTYLQRAREQLDEYRQR